MSYLTSESSAASLVSASRNMQTTEPTKPFYINPDLSRTEAQLAFEQRQKRRAARKAVKRTDGLATWDDADDGTVAGPAAGYTAYIVPVYKKGIAGDVSNYRPMSLTCVTSKILQRIIANRIFDHLAYNNILHPAQHGFK